MTVRKFRSVEEMNQDRWREPGDPELYRAIAEVWALGSRTGIHRFPPGVYRHRTIADMNRLTESWQEANFKAQLESRAAAAQRVTVTEDSLVVDLVDGRTVSVPLAWFPRLLHGTAEERSKLRLIGRGEGIHWDDLDEDISVAGLLAGRASGESQESLARWLRGRQRIG